MKGPFLDWRPEEGPAKCLLGQEKAIGGRAKSPFPSRSREGSYPTVVAGRAWRLPRDTHCDFSLYTLVCHLEPFLVCHVPKRHLHGLETSMLYISRYTLSYMLQKILDTMNN